jgi:hypothetical protein
VGIGRLDQHLLVEVDVARVVHRVEVGLGRVEHDHHPALTHERLAAVQVEQVPEPHAHHEDRVHDRVDVVRADVRDAHRQDVALPLDLDEVLAVDVVRRLPMHGLDLAGLHARHLVGRLDRAQDLAGQPGRCE